MSYSAAFLFLLLSLPLWASPWGEEYFPNTALTTHEGKSVRFFDDLIKDKIVVVNFIYTTCPDTCPLETAQLTKVQELLGDRMGKDVFFYSISIDPENDTVPVLCEYRDRFRAKWTFLTGDRAEIIALRKKLGLYLFESKPNSYNHNVNMLIGNQKTGRCMKRSPFENPHVLADQLGNWLDGWKRPQTADYAHAPKLRDLPPGEQIFRTRCASCHTLNGHEAPGALGPDLIGVSDRRDPQWLLDWLRAPDKMLANKDPIALAMFAKYNKLAMPNLRLTREDSDALIAYMATETKRLADVPKGEVAVLNAWVNEAHPKAKVNAGYMTLVNAGGADIALASVETDAFEKVEIHEMVEIDGWPEMRELRNLPVPAGRMVRLQPGGLHLMLKKPKSHLTAGQKIDLNLTFDNGQQQTIVARVSKR